MNRAAGRIWNEANMWFYVGCYVAACGLFTAGFLLGAAVTNAKHADNVIDLAAERERRRGKAA